MTQPILSVSLKRCVMEDGSTSLSCAREWRGGDAREGLASTFAQAAHAQQTARCRRARRRRGAHLHALLRDKDDAVAAAHGERCQAAALDSLQRVLCEEERRRRRGGFSVSPSPGPHSRRAREHAPIWYSRPSGLNTVMVRSQFSRAIL